MSPFRGLGSVFTAGYERPNAVNINPAEQIDEWERFFLAIKCCMCRSYRSFQALNVRNNEWI